MAVKKKNPDEDFLGGLDPFDPIKGGSATDRDKWWGYDNKKFKRWYHKRKKKFRYYKNVDTEEEMKDYWNEWISLGRPDG